MIQVKNDRHLTSERPPGSAEALNHGAEALSYLRLDDFPCGAPHRGGHTREFLLDACRDVLAVLAGSRYILGASLLNCDADDIAFLNETVVPPGAVCMHGYTHGFERWDMVRGVEDWALGGEFKDIGVEEIRALQSRASDVAQGLRCFTPRHFVAPFNSYTQALLDVLNESEYEFLHTSDAQFGNFAHLEYGNVIPVIAKYQVTNGPARLALQHIGEGQISLHWASDYTRDVEWRKSYERLKEIFS